VAKTCEDELKALDEATAMANLMTFCPYLKTIYHDPATGCMGGMEAQCCCCEKATFVDPLNLLMKETKELTPLWPLNPSCKDAPLQCNPNIDCAACEALQGGKACDANPTALAHVDLTKTTCASTESGSSCANFACQPGYEKMGSVTCINGKWDLANAKCLSPCQADPTFSHIDADKTSCEGTLHGETCTFVCSDGYTPSPGGATCQDGAWAAGAKCNKIDWCVQKSVPTLPASAGTGGAKCRYDQGKTCLMLATFHDFPYLHRSQPQKMHFRYGKPGSWSDWTEFTHRFPGWGVTYPLDTGKTLASKRQRNTCELTCSLDGMKYSSEHLKKLKTPEKEPLPKEGQVAHIPFHNPPAGPDSSEYYCERMVTPTGSDSPPRARAPDVDIKENEWAHEDKEFCNGGWLRLSDAQGNRTIHSSWVEIEDTRVRSAASMCSPESVHGDPVKGTEGTCACQFHPPAEGSHCALEGETCHCRRGQVRIGDFTAGSSDNPSEPIWSEWENIETEIDCKKSEFSYFDGNSRSPFTAPAYRNVRCECRQEPLFSAESEQYASVDWRASPSMNIEGTLTAGQTCQLEHELVVLEGGSLRLEGEQDSAPGQAKAVISVAEGRKTRHFSVYGHLTLVNLILEKGIAWVGGSLQVRGELAKAHLIQSVIRGSSTGWQMSAGGDRPKAGLDGTYWYGHGGAIAVHPLAYNKDLVVYDLQPIADNMRSHIFTSADGLVYKENSEVGVIADPRMVRLILEDSIIENCVAAHGGAIAAARSTIEIRGESYVQDNTAEMSVANAGVQMSQGGKGGGLLLTFGSVVKVVGASSRLHIHRNLAHSSGGGLLSRPWPWKGQNGDLQTTDGGSTSFVNNTAFMLGGAIYVFQHSKRYPVLTDEVLLAGNTFESSMTCKFLRRCYWWCVILGDFIVYCVLCLSLLPFFMLLADFL
jgi:predicted outer membrane repeat protein